MRHLLTFLFLTALACKARAGMPDQREYIFPVRGVEGLYSANFGELRPGHFHGGVDIKTDGAEGKAIVAVADGYVSRVVITAGGYGRAVYLTLRNGTTAVYGHLQRFRDDIEQYVRSERYRRRANSVDLTFGPDRWPVRQGDTLGRSGNSGSSLGPHLHYEVRETPSQRLLNPVRLGIVRPVDTLPPRIVRIHYVEIDSVERDGVCLRAPRESYTVVRSAGGGYRLVREEPVEVGRKGYFIAEVTDRRNGVNNTFGVWRVAASVDGQPFFEYRQDGFTHDLSRCCDAVSCYALQLTTRNEAIRLAQLEAAPGCFYPTIEQRGVVRTAEGELRRIRVEAEDDCGNRSSLEFEIRGRSDAFRSAPDTAALLLRHDRDATVGLGMAVTARIPAGTLYESRYCRPVRCQTPAVDSGSVVLSPAYRILEPTTPLRRSMRVTIRTEVPHRLRLRTGMALRNHKGRVVWLGGTYAGGAVTAATSTAGELFAAADTLPPRIGALFTEGARLADREALRFRADDNLSGVTRWRLEIDGRWVPCDRFPMKETLVHFFDTPPDGKRHEAVLTVTDAAGNTARLKGTFYR